MYAIVIAGAAACGSLVSGLPGSATRLAAASAAGKTGRRRCRVVLMLVVAGLSKVRRQLVTIDAVRYLMGAACCCSGSASLPSGRLRPCATCTGPLPRPATQQHILRGAGRGSGPDRLRASGQKAWFNMPPSTARRGEDAAPADHSGRGRSQPEARSVGQRIGASCSICDHARLLIALTIMALVGLFSTAGGGPS